MVRNLTFLNWNSWTFYRQGLSTRTWRKYFNSVE